ncbi:hypothetical protein SCACP_36980 [Sporomusa carbonis]
MCSTFSIITQTEDYMQVVTNGRIPRELVSVPLRGLYFLMITKHGLTKLSIQISINKGSFLAVKRRKAAFANYFIVVRASSL